MGDALWWVERKWESEWVLKRVRRAYFGVGRVYLNSDEYNILKFDQPNIFHIALGGDGAPFMKDDTTCSWL